jgi:Carboxypeptidase regulatory-like domain
MVVDSTSGQPIHGALVSTNSGSATPTLTDAEGKFQFDGLASGTATLQAVKPGYVSHDGFPRGLPSSFVVEIVPDAPPATLKLTPEGVIFGKITDENSQPVEGVGVLLSRLASYAGRLSPAITARATTDDEGNFRFPNLSRGSAYLSVDISPDAFLIAQKNSAAPQGFARVFYPGVPDISSAAPIKILPGKSVQANLSLKPEPFVRFSGTVTGYSARSQVQLYLTGPDGMRVPTEISFDPRTGTFQSKWIPPGSYTVAAQSVAVQSGSPDLPNAVASQPLRLTSDVSDIHLVLQPTMDIPIEFRGDISDPSAPNGQPPLFVGLIRKDQSDLRGIIYSGRIPPELGGSLTPALILQNVAPGSYRVQLMPTDRYYVESATWGSTDLLREDLVISATSTPPPIIVTCREGTASISGSVSSGDQRATGTVLLFAQGRPSLSTYIPTDERGNFVLPNLAPGSYRVLAVDDAQGFDSQNPDALSKLSSYIQDITLASKQSASLHLELAKLGD